MTQQLQLIDVRSLQRLHDEVILSFCEEIRTICVACPFRFMSFLNSKTQRATDCLLRKSSIFCFHMYLNRLKRKLLNSSTSYKPNKIIATLRFRNKSLNTSTDIKIIIGVCIINLIVLRKVR